MIFVGEHPVASSICLQQTLVIGVVFGKLAIVWGPYFICSKNKERHWTGSKLKWAGAIFALQTVSSMGVPALFQPPNPHKIKPNPRKSFAELDQKHLDLQALSSARPGCA